MAKEIVITEAVEACPYCMQENVFPNYDVEKQGYIVQCKHCGGQMMLCDECLHADDNPTSQCDWHEEVRNGLSFGVCFRGITEPRY
ncbi:hypothetical protein LKD70_14235 [Ruminococcus sp. CLA-AA-H200]|uniref:Uncharacterized protein n=1 Tax=Ruminococcus turbiniformis TaxID=2881258 RepID=A0ABS8G108_9FIRM|nr:hypothetical protein [Ruminococcus turbiniformis]MCC2255559.1 hypothetical protein [Ruminococcus turbiniformis]